MKQFHDLQLKILEKLLFSPDLTYSILKPYSTIENNSFNFHLKQLITTGYISKKDGLYSLTALGKEFANRIDTNSSLKLQAKIAVILICLRKKNTEALIHTRLKHPFYGCQGYMSGKVDYGESIYETAHRELKQETNLKGIPTLFSITHERVYSPAGDLLEDKFLHFFVIKNPKGKLRNNDEGSFCWVKIDAMSEHISKPFISLETHIALTSQAIHADPNVINFEEKKIISQVF